MLTLLENTAYATWVRESLWGWAIMLTIHAVGTATVLGIVSVTCLRMLGFFRPISYASLEKLLDIAWIGVVANILSGFSLFTTQATNYVVNFMFMIKLSFAITGMVLIWFLQKTLKREAAAWDASGAVSSLGLRFVIASLVVWSVVLIGGRLTAYVTGT